MKNFQWLLYLSMIGLLSSCIGDDIINDEVDPIVRVVNLIDTLQVGTDYQFEASFLNNIGLNEDVPFDWSSSDPSIIAISPTGIASAITAGQVSITATATTDEDTYDQTFSLIAGASTSEVEETSVRTGTISTTSSYELTGEFNITNTDGPLLIDIGEDYRASSALPGLFVYLSNNPNSISGAKEIAEVKVFSGAHQYTVTGVDINKYNYLLYYCKPFNVKVGDGKID